MIDFIVDALRHLFFGIIQLPLYPLRLFAGAARRAFTRLRLLLETHLQRLLAALFCSLCVVVLSLAAPALYLFLEHYIPVARPPLLPDYRLTALVAAFSGLTAIILMSLLRERTAAFANRILERLATIVRPDDRYEAGRIQFLIDRYALSFGNYLRGQVGGTQEWMIILRQAEPGASRRHRYSIDGLVQQATVLEQYLRQIAARNRNAPTRAPVVRWVCFVSNEGKFCAFQKYPIFRFHILVKKNARYAAILNNNTAVEFEKAIDIDIQLSDQFSIADAQNATREAIIPDAIPGLQKIWLRQGITSEMALSFLVQEDKSHAMLVSTRNLHEPLGIVSVGNLARQVLLEPLDHAGQLVHRPTPNDRGNLYGDRVP
jgi:hypothetical protein